VNFQDNFQGYEKIVFAIGDSYTQGTGLPSDANYPFQLDLILNTGCCGFEYSKKFAVVNLGLAAFGLKQAIISAELYQAVLGTPNYILWLGCDNDYEDDLSFESGNRHKHLVDENPHYSIFLKPLQIITNDVEIGKRLKLAWANYRRNSNSGKKSFSESVETHFSESVAMKLSPRLNELLVFCCQHDTKLIVSWANHSGESYVWLKKWAGENDVGFADWWPRVESLKKAIPLIPLANPHSGGHYRTWVNKMMAVSFADELLRHERR